MADLTKFDWTSLPLGTGVPGGWMFVGKLTCECGGHQQPAFVAILKKGGSYHFVRCRSQGGCDQHRVHPLHAKYESNHWKMEARNVWNDLSLSHPLEVQALPRPRGVRYR